MECRRLEEFEVLKIKIFLDLRFCNLWCLHFVMNVFVDFWRLWSHGIMLLRRIFMQWFFMMYLYEDRSELWQNHEMFVNVSNLLVSQNNEMMSGIISHFLKCKPFLILKLAVPLYNMLDFYSHSNTKISKEHWNFQLSPKKEVEILCTL